MATGQLLFNSSHFSTIDDNINTNDADTMNAEEAPTHPSSKRSNTRSLAKDAVNDKYKFKFRRDLLNVATLNVNRADLTNIRVSLKRYRWDIVGLTEMKLINNDTVGKDVILPDAPSTKDPYYRGVALLLNDKAQRALSGVVKTSERVLGARFRGTPYKLFVVVAYAPQKDSAKEVKERFETDLELTIALKKPCEKLILLGDFNCSVGEGNETYEDCMGPYGLGEMNDRGKDFIMTARKNKLFITNTIFKVHKRHRYTWENANYKVKDNRKQLDYILVDQDMKKAVIYSRSFPGALPSTDHCMVITTLQVVKVIRDQPSQPNRRLNIEKVSDPNTLTDYQERLNNAIPPLMESPLVYEELTNKIKSCWIEATSNKAPAPKKPWISESTMELHQLRVKLKPQRNRNDLTRAEYRKVCKQFKKSIKNDKEQWFSKNAEDLEAASEKGNTYEVYRILKQLSGNPKKSKSTMDIVINDENGRPITDFDQQVDRWTRYCTQLYQNQHEELSGSDTSTTYPSPNIAASASSNSPPNLDTVNDKNITREELLDGLKRLKNGKTTGLDGIPAELYKGGNDALTDVLLKLFNQIWDSETLPNGFGQMTIIPIPKGANKTSNRECSNYRTITLINHSMKLLLSIILRKIQRLLNSQIAESQFGFRPGKSTTRAILTLKLLAEKFVEKNKELFALFIDFQKAFDRVPHAKLFDVLRYYNVPVKIIAVIRAIYKQSEGVILWKKRYSKTIPIAIGVHQGDPLSPVLFITFLDHIMKNVPKLDFPIGESKTRYRDIAYADDVTLLAQDQSTLQALATALNDKAKEYNMSINTSKTKLIVFKRAKNDRTPIPFLVEGVEIEQCEEFKYLGREFTSHNSDSKAIEARIKKARAATCKIVRFLQSSVSNQTKLKVVQAVILSVVSYGCETWATREADLKRLNGFENKLLRLMMNIKWYQLISNKKIYAILNKTERLSTKLARRKLQFIGNVAQTGDNTLFPLFLFDLNAPRPSGGSPIRFFNLVTAHVNINIPMEASNTTSWNPIIIHILDQLEETNSLDHSE